MFKKIITSFVLLILLVWVTRIAFALTNKEKWIILSKYNDKEVEFIFKNDLNVNALDALDLFKSNNKINIYENVLKNVWDEKERLQKENLEIVKKIDDLQFQLKSLSKDIKTLEDETKKINSNIVKTTIEINKRWKSIEKAKKSIEKNSDILREYIAYIYKKWNLFLDNWKLDNLKAILLSWEDLDQVINDIYFKELLSIAWKSLIEKHRKLVFELYIEKKNLESETTTLKKLRKSFIIKKKILNDKKNFKEKILDVSKWKESLYKKYIKDKIKIETKLKIKAFGERIKFYNTSKKILWKEGCKFVDVSKNTPESRILSEKCYKLNKIISLEAKLEENRLNNKNKDEFNMFKWPVSPYNGISAYFHDVWYKKQFNVNHEAIDIKADQSTNIVAPLDWYVISIKKPTDTSYAYIALKHSNWYVSVYGHISESLVEKYDYVKSWDIFAKTGWTFWTLWAWYITTWPHLHFEILKDKAYIDPLKQMDLSVLNFKTLPTAYRLDFFIDYKNRTWKDYFKKQNFTWWKIFTLIGANEIERQKNFLRKYARSDFNNWEMWIEESLRWNVDPTFMMCIWLAESWLGRHLKTSYNVWNVWNVDSGWTWTMPSPRSWVWWMWHTLNNKYLRNYNKISQLSWYWRIWNAPIYASSPINWHRNVIKCMSAIKQQYIPDDYNFRTY